MRAFVKPKMFWQLEFVFQGVCYWTTVWPSRQGALELGKKPTSTARKDWKPRLFVLKWYPTTDRSTLDYYKDTKKRWQKQEAVGVVSLWPTFEVSLAHSCPYKFTIQLQTVENLLYLACDTEDDMMQWLNHIQMQRKLSPKSGEISTPPPISTGVTCLCQM